MAFSKSKVKEHDFKRINRDVKAEKIANIILLHGKEQYLIDWAINLIADKYINEAARSFDFVRMQQENFSVDAMIEACETLSMFSKSRVVAVTDFSYLGSEKVKNISEADENALINYLQNIPEGTILIFSSQKLDKRKKIYKEIKKKGEVYEFEGLSEDDLKNFIIKKFKMSGKVCKAYILKEIIELSGYYHKETQYSLYNLENDLKKMIAHSTGDEIVASDMLAAISGNLETNVFAMVDAVSRGRKDEAFEMLFNILDTEESVYKLLAIFVSQFEIILWVKELKERNVISRDMPEILGVHEYRVKKALAFSERYTVMRLKKILINAYETDIKIKSGLLDKRTALEFFIAEI
ncbi:MAG: DNA polymerase III subunit delta [Eubacteriales bacterium]|nr:DNA polymerase III subunit delta [Eubacteriales bacterium]MDD4389646.1 DNA polymerase III subunit delta [Eubacteriales bacterium]